MPKNSTKTLLGGLALFAIAFLISRAQFFACPTIEISNDSGEYIHWIDSYLNKGQLPPANFVPIGYPLIIKALTSVHDTLSTIVYFQILFTFFSFSILIYTVWRFYDKLIYFLFIGGVCIYVQVPNNLYFDSYIASESFYNSSLVLLFAAFILFIQKRDKKSALLLSIALAAPILFRPTGLFTIVILLFLSGYLVIINRKDLLPSFTLPFLALYFLLSVYSTLASKAPLFFAGRIAMEYAAVDSNSIVSASDSAYKAEFDKLTRADRAIIQYKNYCTQSQIYTRIDEANNKYFVRNFAHTSEFTCCNFEPIDSTKELERKQIFKEFYDTNRMSYLMDKEKSVKQSKLFKIYDLLQTKIIKRVFLSPFWILLMFASFVFAFAVTIYSKFNNLHALLLTLIIMINLGTMGVVIAGNHLPLLRYSYPAEFIFLLQLPFLIDLIRERINAIK
jgi:hypothetical protein